MIREATGKDIPHIQRLIGVGVDEGHLLGRSREEIEEVVDQGRFYIAHHVMGIVGCVSLEVYTPRLAEVRSLVVMPNFRNGDIGKLLIERCAQEARKLGLQRVLAITDQPAFFQAVGFREDLEGHRALFLNLD